MRKIKKGIEDLQKAVEDNYNSGIITDTGTIVAPPKLKYPLTVKLAIYLIALYSFIQIIKELVLIIIKAVEN